MRLNNLTTEQKVRIKADLGFLKEVVESEYVSLLEELVDYPSNKLEELRGQAKVCRQLLKLL